MPWCIKTPILTINLNKLNLRTVPVQPNLRVSISPSVRELARWGGISNNFKSPLHRAGAKEKTLEMSIAKNVDHNSKTPE